MQENSRIISTVMSSWTDDALIGEKDRGGGPAGVMPVPWEHLAKAKWKQFIVAIAARYDNNPQLHYMVMSGFQQTGECYIANTQAAIDFFNANAEAAGYQATDTLPAGLVAWEATVKEIVAQYMTSFPNTPLLITGARPHGGPGRLFAK